MLSNEEIEKRLNEKYNGLYSLVGEYEHKRSKITMHCNLHNCDFAVSAETATRMDRTIYSCPECKKRTKRDKKEVFVKCSYCGKTFSKRPSSLLNSKSGLYFCCREHKDIAQRIENGVFEIWPEHYQNGNGKSSYRSIVFRNFEHKCCVCGYNEEIGILEVHHKDGNRENNDISNLCILCPNCHRKITLKLYNLTNDYKLIKN